MKTIDKIRAITDLQRSHARGIVGLYLSGDEIQELADQLTQDDPATGAIGRFHRIPVYPSTHNDPPEDCVSYASLNGIRYAFVQMDVID